MVEETSSFARGMGAEGSMIHSNSGSMMQAHDTARKVKNNDVLIFFSFHSWFFDPNQLRGAEIASPHEIRSSQNSVPVYGAR